MVTATTTQKTSVQRSIGPRLLFYIVSTLVLTGPVAAETLNLTAITDILDAVVEMMPSLLDLIVAAVPIIVVLAIVGFVMSFLDKILDMMKGHF